MGHPFCLSKKQIEWAAEKHYQGYSWPQIGVALYCNERTVENAVRKAGYPTGKKRDLPELHYDFSQEE